LGGRSLFNKPGGVTVQAFAAQFVYRLFFLRVFLDAALFV
jgi:hypothetical protein